MLSFEPFLETVFGSEITPWAGADVKVCVCRLDEVRIGMPGAEHSSDEGAGVVSWAFVTPLSITGLSSSRLIIAAASPDGKGSCADEMDVGLVGREVAARSSVSSQKRVQSIRIRRPTSCGRTNSLCRR